MNQLYPDLDASTELDRYSDSDSSSLEALPVTETLQINRRPTLEDNTTTGSVPSAPTLDEISVSRFKTVPELNLNFKKVSSGDKKHPNSFCLACKETVYSTDTSKLMRHLQLCSADEETKEMIIGAVAAATQKSINNLSPENNKRLNFDLATVIIANNIPLRIVECSALKSLVTKLKPDWRLPCRRELSNFYIPALAKRCDEKFMQRLKNEDEFYISTEFDHWKDAVCRSVLAVVATFPDGERHLLSLEDVTLRGHSTNSIIKSLRKSLSQIPALKLNAIMSDSASSCKKARSRLVEKDYPHLIQYRCQAHLFNLIGNKMMEDEVVESMMTGANKLVSFISSNSQIQSLLSELGYRKLVHATSVRWYSHVAMLESLLEVKNEAQRLFSASAAIDSQHLKLLNCELFWEDVPRVIEILKPLTTCIATAERADGTLGESTKAVLDYGRFLFSSDWSDSFILATVKAFLHYLSIEKLGSEELGLMFAAYSLDKRFNINYLTIEGLNLAFEAIISVALKSGYDLKSIDKSLVEEFKKFKGQHGSFSNPAVENKGAASWWRDQPSTTILKKVALRLAMLKSSSANTERLFSTLKLVQSPLRTRFALNSLERMAKVKICMKDQEANELFELFESEDVFVDEDADVEIKSAHKTTFKEFTRSVFAKVEKILARTDIVKTPQMRIEYLDSARQRESFNRFTELVNYDIINSARPRESFVVPEVQVGKEEILKKFRASLE